MSTYDIPEKYKVIKNGLIKLGLKYEHKKRHDVATCTETGHKTTVPRHKTNTLNRFTVGTIYKFLIDNGYKNADIKKAFKWK